MVENSNISRPAQSSQLPSIDGVRSGAKKELAVGEGGPAFLALLEKLQAQAQSLQHDSKNVDAPEQLNEAVDRARSSLSDALSLSDKLLEAYREATQRDTSSAPDSGGADRAR
jgi:flagellar hook-basal body complex protein FliE